MGIRFHEVMKGPFAHGATDPVAGAREGLGDGSVLELHATATIDDVPRFVADDEHVGELTGAVTYRPISVARLPASGVFKLFTPTPDPNLKLMVYRVTFEHDGRRYCLDGAKHVRRRAVWHAWRDTTTLYCRLHAGDDPQAPVIAAGVLRLGVLAFGRQLLSFRPVNAPALTHRARSFAGFLGFFSAQLLDTYFTRQRV
jgi:hypothetical protein